MTKSESPIEWKFRKAWAQYDDSLILVQELPMLGGKYKVDFVHLSTSYAIELDGRAHHIESKVFTGDRKRQRELERLGWRFLRFSGFEVNTDVTAVIDEVRQTLFDAPRTPEKVSLETLKARGYEFRESNILRNPIVIDYEGAEEESHAAYNKNSDIYDYKQERQGYTYVYYEDDVPHSSNVDNFEEEPVSHYYTQRLANQSASYSIYAEELSQPRTKSYGGKNKDVRLLPNFDGKALSFFLSGFFGPFFGVLLLFLFDFIFLAQRLFDATSTLPVVAFIASPFVGWFLLIRLAKYLFKRSKARLAYNVVLTSILAIILWNVLPSIVENPASVFDSAFSTVSYAIPVIGCLAGLQRYVTFWQELS